MPEYKAWVNMLYRCYSQQCNSYKHYGAGGILECDKWKYSFDKFLKDMGPTPELNNKYSIERINNNGNYDSGNLQMGY